MKSVLQTVLHPPHLRRTGLIALVVGSWLSLVNLGDLLLVGPITVGLLIKLALDYLTPFVVANLGLLSRAKAPPQ